MSEKRSDSMNRRGFLRRAACGAALAGGALRPLRGADAPARPNILWLSCEDISPNLGCFGDAYAVTPNLDAFARRAVRYTQAFGITGVCAPNRSCLITGVYPSSLGSHDMRTRIALPGAVKCFTEYLREAGYYCTNNVKTDYNFPVLQTAWDECSRKAHWKNRRPGQPFFAVFNNTVSHESQIRVPPATRQKNTSRLKPEQFRDPAKAPVPPFHPDTPEVRLDWSRYYDNITAVDYWFADHLKELADAGLEEDTIVFFFGDNGVGMPGCKKWVWESGLRIPLIVRLPGQHRARGAGEPGAACDRLVSFVDFAPTVLNLAGVKVPPHMQGTAFLGEQSGLPRQYVHAIRDRMAERYDTVRVVRDRQYQYIRNFMPHLTWSQFVNYTEEMPTMKVWRRLAEEGRLAGPAARYFSPAKPVEELYDTTADPHQVHNLAGDERHREALERLRNECREWMKRTHDLGLLPEFELHRRSAGSTPWDAARDPALNPLDRLLDAADLANAMNPANLPKLLDLLKADDAAVRWWGALGLVALGDKAAPAGEALQAALKDPAPNVRIAAADALCNLGRYDQALPTLTEGLRHTTPFIRLRALNVLDRIGEKARPALAEIRGAAMKDPNPAADYLTQMVGYVSKKFSRP